MRRFRRRRRRLAALVLLPLTATAGTSTATAELQLPDTEEVRTQPKPPTIEASKRTVRIGDRLRLSGRVPGASHTDVVISFRREGGKRFRPVRTVETGGTGRYRMRVKPAMTGGWRAEVVDRPRPRPARVRVRSITRVRAERHAVVDRTVRVRGRVRPGGHRRVVVDVGGDSLRTRTGRDGRFVVRWRPDDTGRYRVRARARGNGLTKGSRDRGPKLTVYRPAEASWYGPGFYGQRTACGQTLTPSTVGVAHKTMPCGTRVWLRHHGRTVKARVIDRGPYAAGREFDLTSETKERLRFGSTGTVLSSK